MSHQSNEKFPLALKHGFYIEQHAEMGLVKPIIDNQIFSKDLDYLFAKYPVAPLHEKGDLVCQLMSGLWPGSIGEAQFKVYKDFEIFLTSLGKRDHFYHQFLVFLIGTNIIWTICENLPNEKKNEIFGFIEDRDIYLTWLMSSTYHDFGYPLSVADDVIRQLSGFYDCIGLSKISQKINVFLDKNPVGQLFMGDKDFLEKDINVGSSTSIKSFLKNCLEKQFDLSGVELVELWGALKEDRNHGYISSVMLCANMLDECSENESSYSKHIEYAAPAIISHIFSGKYSSYSKKVRLTRNPYAYLLYLIDNIQDWSRVFTESEKHENFTLTGYTFDHSQKKIEMSYYLSHSKWSRNFEEKAREKIRERGTTIKSPISDLNCGISIKLKYYLQFSQEPEVIELQL